MHPLVDRMQDELHEAGADGTDDRPRVFMDGRRVDLAAVDGPLVGTAASIVASNGKTLPPILARLDAERLILADMRGADLSELTRMRRLTHLCISTATRLSDIGPVGELEALRYLEISATSLSASRVSISECRCATSRKAI